MISSHDLAEISLDLTRSHRILDGFGKISLDLGRFRWLSISPETDSHLPTTRIDELVTITGRLRVGKPLTQSCTGRLRVGQKPDPPDPQTALIVYIFFKKKIIYLIMIQLMDPIRPITRTWQTTSVRFYLLLNGFLIITKPHVL